MKATVFLMSALTLFFAAAAESGGVPVYVEATTLTRDTGHWGNIKSAVFSPDGKTLATVGYDSRIILWDADTGRVKSRFFSPNPHKSLAFSPNGAEFAHGDHSEDILIRDAETGTLKAELKEHEDSIHTLIYGRDGKTLFSAGDGILMWDAEKRELIKSIGERTNTYTALTLSPDGETIAAAIRIRAYLKSDSAIELRHADTGALKKQIDLSGVSSINRLSFSPDSRKLASDGSNGIIMWDVETGGEIGALEEDSGADLVQYLPDGERLAFFLDGSLMVRDLKTGERVQVISSPAAPFSKAISPDGQRAALSFFFGAVQVWNLNDGSLQAAFGGNDTGPIYSAAFSRDGKTLALGCADGGVRLWDVHTQRLLHRLWQAPYTYYRVKSVDFSKDGNTVAGASYVDIALWDVETGRFKRALGDEYNRHHRNYGPAVYSPDGETIASIRYDDRDGGRVTIIELRDADTGEATQAITIGDGLYWQSFMTYSPDGRTIAYAGSQFFNVETGRLRATVTHHSPAYCLAYSPDGGTFAVGHRDGTVAIWNAQTYRRIRTIQAQPITDQTPRYSRYVNAVAYSPNGRTLASGGVDGLVRLWGTDSGKLKAVLKGHAGSVYALAYSPDGRYLVSGGSDGSAQLWNMGINGGKPIQWADIRLPEEANAPAAPALLQNYPNPFNPETWIPFDLSETSTVRIAIYNGAGELIRALDLGTLPAGYYRSRQKAAYWDGRNDLGERAASGVYFARIEAGSFTALRRMVLFK